MVSLHWPQNKRAEMTQLSMQTAPSHYQSSAKCVLQLCCLPFQSSDIHLPQHRHPWAILAGYCSTIRGAGALYSCPKSPPQLTALPKLVLCLVEPCGISDASAVLKSLQCFCFAQEFTAGGEIPESTRALHAVWSHIHSPAHGAIKLCT